MQWASLAVAVLVAGCSDGGPPAASENSLGTLPPADYEGLGLEAGPETGLIRGVVVDTAIRPIVAATVKVSGGGTVETVSDAGGLFGFSNVQPGTYFLTVTKQGYASVQTAVEVVGGVQNPTPVKVHLEALPGTEPYIVPLHWSGFMKCSLTVAIAFATGCLVGDQTGDDSRRFDPIERTPTFLQTELYWEPSQALSTNLCMRHYASTDMGGPNLMGDVCGPSFLTQKADGKRLNETEVGAGLGIERVVWVDDFAVQQTFGLAWEQRFEVYSFLFYNLVPDSDWSFVEDGEYPLE